MAKEQIPSRPRPAPDDWQFNADEERTLDAILGEDLRKAEVIYEDDSVQS
jgi:hypothetical protein